MAIRKREGRKCPWQVYWNNPFTGKREAVNFSDENEAKKYDSLVKHRLKFERESFRPEREPEEKEVVTLEMAYMMYLREKQFNKNSLQWQMQAMKQVLRNYGDRPVSEMDRGIFIQALADFQANTGIKSATVHNRASVFRAVLRWAAENGLCGSIAFPRLPSPDYEKFVPPTPDELAAMLHAAPPHIQRVILIGSQCGVRVGNCELFQLGWDDVDFSRKVLRVHGSKKNKSAPWREVPLRRNFLPILEAWKSQDAAIPYIIHFQGKPVSSIKNAWKTMLQAAGITRRIRPYDLRHAFATELIAAGTDIGTVAKLMGHSSPAMILNHYQYVMDKQKRAAVENLPEIPYVPKPMCPKEKGLRLYDVTP